MPVIITPDSEYGKELDRWNRAQNVESPHTPGLYDGQRAVGFQPFPRMVYKALQNRSGQTKCLDRLPDPRTYSDPQRYAIDEQLVDDFNKACTRLVRSEAEYAQAKADGWRDSPADAEAYAEGLAQDVAQAAAEAAFKASKMSGKAAAEYKRREAATDSHVTD